MLLGVVLLYVGAVLVVNGIWLLGQAKAAAQEAADRTLAGAEASASGAAVAKVGGPLMIRNREVAILNVFTGFIGVVAAIVLAAQGNEAEDLGSVRASGYILLFAFTYLWVAYNQWVPDTDGHGFGWYCLFVAITAIPAGIWALSNADGSDASVYLGICWFAWSILWFMFFLLLALERPIARATGMVAIVEGIGTAWVFGILLLEDAIAF